MISPSSRIPELSVSIAFWVLTKGNLSYFSSNTSTTWILNAFSKDSLKSSLNLTRRVTLDWLSKSKVKLVLNVPFLSKSNCQLLAEPLPSTRRYEREESGSGSNPIKFPTTDPIGRFSGMLVSLRIIWVGGEFGTDFASFGFEPWAASRSLENPSPVSYTHLTLPTILRV